MDTCVHCAHFSQQINQNQATCLYQVLIVNSLKPQMASCPADEQTDGVLIDVSTSLSIDCNSNLGYTTDPTCYSCADPEVAFDPNFGYLVYNFSIFCSSCYKT